MLILVSYDIPNNKRRTKIAKILLDYGERVQYSVFECNLTVRQIKKLMKELAAVVNDKEDSVRAYRLCAACEQMVETMGQAQPPQEEPDLFIV
jgi:CRISPR-associated protein Cas2